MQLPQEAIDELKQLFKDHYGVEMSDEDARESAENLLNMVKAVMKPIQKQNLLDDFGGDDKM